MVEPTMTPKKFWEELKYHDWYYGYSDDSRAYHKGSQAEESLQLTAKGFPVLEKLYKDWKTHMFSGKEFGTERTPEPPCPTE